MRINILHYCYILYLIAIITSANAQTINMRSVTGLSGGSFNNNQFYIQQSIGQTGAINSYKAGGYILSQGFIQPVTIKNKKTIEKHNKTPINVTVYPNPLTTILNIQFTEPLVTIAHIHIYDILGQQVLIAQMPAQQSFSVDMSHLGNGIYFTKIWANNSLKVIKTK